MKIRPRFTTRHLLFAMAVVCLLLTAWRGLAHYIEWYALAPGEIVASNDWPFRVRQLAKNLEAAGLRPEARVYEFNGEAWFLDSRYAWRVTVPPESLDLAIEALQLSSVPPDRSVPRAFGLSYPFWWSGTVDAESQRYAAFDESYSSDYFVVYDTDAQSLRVWQVTTWAR